MENGVSVRHEEKTLYHPRTKLKKKEDGEKKNELCKWQIFFLERSTMLEQVRNVPQLPQQMADSN